MVNLDKMKRKFRTTRLTPEEAERDKKLRDKIMKEYPPMTTATKTKFSCFTLFCENTWPDPQPEGHEPCIVERYRATEDSAFDAMMLTALNAQSRGRTCNGYPQYVVWGIFVCPAEKDPIPMEKMLDKQIVIDKLKGILPIEDDEMGKLFK